MEFFCYHRDRQGSMGLRRAVLEQQWGYMDNWLFVLEVGVSVPQR